MTPDMMADALARAQDEIKSLSAKIEQLTDEATSYHDAYVMAAEGHQTLMAEVERLTAAPTYAGVARDAYEAGARAVHAHWCDSPGEAPKGDPDFSEAAMDYASSLPAAPPPADPQEGGEA
jgi:hypothetical protein